MQPFENWRGFAAESLTPELKSKLTEMARQARGHILKMTTVANSGHPGGSMSSLEMYLSLYNLANVDPKNPWRDDRDRIVISHGHASPGAYASLAAAGFFSVEQALHGFRQAGSPFEGHVERSVPGIEWDTGNLGQGLSAGIGKAFYSRLSGKNFQTWVLMGDGEQQKGQISEGRRVAVKFGFSRLCVFIDFNGLQISGKISEILPQNIEAEWKADGWQVRTIDAHNLDEIYAACKLAVTNTGAPIMFLARSVMSKGIGFMENKEEYHGAAIKPEQMAEALKSLGGTPPIVNDLERLKKKRSEGPPPAFRVSHALYPKVHPGEPILYKAGEKSDNRGAWGKALVSVADANKGNKEVVFAVFDCDLAKSVKTDGFAKKYPDNFFQMGITEHNTATVAGSLSAESAVSIWSDFGMFGIAETYNQQRLNDINHTNLKLFCTHSGVNVGEDGKTHQSIDYFALLDSTFGWKVITPSDPNQTDRIVRYVLTRPGNYAVVMGRAVIPVVTKENGQAYFGEDYVYRYGRMERIREGKETVLIAAGNMLPYAMTAWQLLANDGKKIGLISVSDWSDLHAEDLKYIGGYDHVVTLEDHNVKTGLGARIAASLFDLGIVKPMKRFGVSEYASSGPPDDLYRLLGIDGESVAEGIRAFTGRRKVTV